MERIIPGPTQPQKISEADQRRIDEFKSFMMMMSAEELRKIFLRIYFEFSQAITVVNDSRVNIAEETSGDLYYLQCLIEIFD